MTLEDDPRTGIADSGTVTITDADDGSPQTALQIRSDGLFKPTRIKIEYATGATNEPIDIEIHDNADGTAAADLDDLRESIPNVDSDDQIVVEGPYREFENDVLVRTENGNQDGDIDVSVYGYHLTSLSDMSGF